MEPVNRLKRHRHTVINTGIELQHTGEDKTIAAITVDDTVPKKEALNVRGVALSGTRPWCVT